MQPMTNIQGQQANNQLAMVVKLAPAAPHHPGQGPSRRALVTVSGTDISRAKTYFPVTSVHGRLAPDEEE